MDFFLDGVTDIAQEAIGTVSKITTIRDRDLMKIQKLSTRASESAAIVLPKLFQLPIVTARNIQEWTGFTFPGAQNIIERFVEMGILVPRKQSIKHAQSYIYKDYVNIFSN